MKKILAFFGAFNPPTVAHLTLADFARKQTGAERVLFVPSKSDYIRISQQKDFAYGEEERLRMLRRAAESRPWMAVTDIEIRMAKQPRTYQTLCLLRESECEASLMIGSDKLGELETGWAHVEEIAREFGIVVLTRGTDECEKIIRKSALLSALSPMITVLETPAGTRSVSSTAVRRRMAELRALRQEISGMVPEEILPLL